MQMKRFPYILIILSLLCITAAPASAELGLSLGAGFGFDFYDNLEYMRFYTTHPTGNFNVTYEVREDLHLGVGGSITKIYFNDIPSASGEGQHLVPFYEVGPVFSYRVLGTDNGKVGLSLRPALRYVWGYLYDDGDAYYGERCPRVGTYKGFNARFAISAYYGVLALSFGYDLSQVKLHDITVRESWFGRMRWRKLDLSGPNVSLGLNLGL